MIYYNTLLLSRVHKQKEDAGNHEAMSVIQGMSPVAWQHVNLFGSFEFNPNVPKVDIEALVAIFADKIFLG